MGKTQHRVILLVVLVGVSVAAIWGMRQFAAQPQVSAKDEEEAQRKLYELVMKDVLNDEDLAWLQRVAESRSALREDALIRLGMFVMAHPESADTVVPRLVGLYRRLGKKDGEIILGLVGGNPIKLEAPSKAARDIALIAPEFRELKMPTALIRSSGTPSG